MNIKKSSTYVARPVDAAGNAAYSEEDNAVWHDLIKRQIPLIQERACADYLHGLELLNLPHDHIPQCHEISKILHKKTGWALTPVPALIPFEQFFSLLAHRQFPAATFIRRRAEMDYLQEPDIFHEIFGHCPLLTNQAYADFAENYGKLGLQASPQDRVMLARLYWFTIEFGLLKTPQGLRIYGGGILSSKEESIYALESKDPIRQALNPIEALRTPYRIDIKQPVYFIIEDFDYLFKLIEMDLMGLIQEARLLGMHEPVYL